ncbi:MAG: fused MFS/spermidine synthase [Gemmatimonadetes bacterium]|nr:fused MFS/spermidine synthase [Gemmatimonadota bacterium]
MTLLLTFVFILSGAAGLIYESIWSRYLGLFVGHSAYAQVIVLVIFLGGMSLGATVASRRSERLKEPLLWYAIVELAVGLLGLVFHDAFGVVSALAYDTVFPALAGGPLLVVVKWLIAALLILPQSVLLGATFPLMTAGLLRRLGQDHADPATASGRVIGVLYFANSIGAAVGVLVAGFWLIGAVGLQGTLLTAALVNIVVAVVTYVALQAMRSGDAEPDEIESAMDAAVLGPPQVVAEGVPERPRTPAVSIVATAQASQGLWKLLLGVSFGTAVASFIYEIAWIRMLALVLGSATHAFELMLSAFILGLALGALWIRRRADTERDPVRLLGLVQVAMGTLAIATLAVYGSSFHWMASLIEALDENAAGYRLYNFARYGISLAVMLPPTFCAGVTLPLITRMLLGEGHGERTIGAVYAWNTLGSIVGVAAAALWLMPILGLKLLLVTGGAIDIVLGVVLLLARERARPEVKGTAMIAAIAGALVIAASLIAPPFDPGILSSGVFRYGTVPERGAREILFYEDGRTASVSVRLGSDSGYSLATNGKPDASISRYWFDEPPTVDSLKSPLGGDESTQVLLPLITLAHMPKATQAAVIGFGSGISSHLLLGSEYLDRLVTIDIEPQMIEASKLFKPANLRAYDDPRSHFVHDDAKSYFAASATRYDLILSEPSNPWVSGVSGLFTDEFYGRVRTYLTPDGVFGQWLHLYEIDDRLVLDVLAALHRNFRSYAVYLTNDVDVLVVASNAERLPVPDWSVLQYTDIALDLARFVPITPEALDATILLTRAELAPLLDSFPTVNSDFRPALDLGAERTRFLRHSATGFLGMSSSRYDVAAAIGGRAVHLGPARRSSLAIPRVESQALVRRVRGSEELAPNDTVVANRKFQQARIRQAELDMWMASGRAPTDWFTWFTDMLEVEADRHAGTMGVVDSAWYGAVERYMVEQHAPRDGISGLRFMRAAAAYDWAAAAREVLPLLEARSEGRQWIPPETFYEAAIVARLRVGDVAGARALFGRMASGTDRKPTDLRMRLIDAHIKAAERALDR